MMETARLAPVAAPSARENRKALACPVCHSQTFSRRSGPEGMVIEACDGCGLLAQNPQPSNDQLAAIYGSNYFIGSSENDRLAPHFDLVKRATASLQLDEIAAYLRKR